MMMCKFSLFIIIILVIYYRTTPNYNIKYINNILIPKYLNLGYNDKIKNKIRIAIYTGTLHGGGRAKITTILINYLINIEIFDIYLFTNEKKKK